MQKQVKGTVVVGGSAKGKVKIIDCSCPDYIKREVQDSDRELGRFVRVLKTYCDNTRKTIEHIDKNIGHRESRILGSHIKMVHDLALQTELISYIINDGMCAEEAIDKVCDSFISRFLETDIEFVRQLAVDVTDLKINVLNMLMGIEPPDVEHFDEDTIVVSQELTPSVISRLDLKRTKAIIVEYGNSNSHCAQIHRAIDIPGMIRAKGLMKSVHNGDVATLDGEKGILTIE